MLLGLIVLNPKSTYAMLAINNAILVGQARKLVSNRMTSLFVFGNLVLILIKLGFGPRHMGSSTLLKITLLQATNSKDFINFVKKIVHRNFNGDFYFLMLVILCSSCSLCSTL